MKLLSFVCRLGIHDHRCKRSHVAAIILAVFGLASITQGQQANTLKWDQPPAPATNVFYGWNQESVYNLLVTADDWVCTNASPITRIRWWGSFIGWTEPQAPNLLPAYWRIHIWTDNPANQPPTPQPWSHPGQVIHEIIVTNVPFACAGMDYHDDGGACPITKPPSPGSSPLETCYVWDLQLNPSQYFHQPNGTNIFWISITAVYASPTQPQFPFGIKTRPRSFSSPAPDAAVSIRIPNNPVPGSIYLDGFPLVCPEPYLPNNPTNLWDLAFELYSADTTVGSKWEQLPDLSTNGVDVRATFDPQHPTPPPPPFLLADDFNCTQPGFITNIVIWGSWLRDRLPLNDLGFPDPSFVEFTLSIHTDDPDSDGPTGPDYSRPSNTVWMAVFPPGTFLTSLHAGNIREGFFTPPTNYVSPSVPGDTNCYKYEFPISPAGPVQPFFQEGTAAFPRVYWLDVQARIIGIQSPDPVLRPKFGWKTSVTNWNDDAVWANLIDSFPGPGPAAWSELRYPLGHPSQGKSMDLAFRINTGGTVTGPETVKWTQPPVVYPNPTNLYNGWNEPSIYGGGFWPGHGFITNIVADDWLCTNAQPVSDIHWWGSFLGWRGTNLPPQLPVAYRFSIWEDVPKNVNNPFSHPGDLIWDLTVSTTDANLRGNWVGWDVDPRTSCLEVESCFKFNYVIPNTNNWFNQKPGSNIYWLSISAVYPGGQLGNNPFGWKTRPHTSPPPDDAVRIFIPNAPVPGSIYINGEPIEYPAGVSWDMAFQLTSPPQVEDTLDFGDAPDPVGGLLYPTRLANNGARHTVVATMFLGAGVDVEPDGQPNAASTGDDINLLFPGIPFPPGDEDGVTFTSPLFPGFLATVDVKASANGFLNAWFDFGADGSWAQPGDQIFAGQPLVPGVNSLVFLVPAGASPNASYSRWRFSSVAALSYTGLAPDGEVEDHQHRVENPPPPNGGIDYGDAPNPPYPTLIASGGAGHIIYTNFVLGTNIDAEPDGQPGAFKLDDTTGVPDDEDGVAFVTALARGSVASASVILKSGFGPGRLDAWVDFNADGTWGVGEQIATSQLLFPGLNSVNFPVPALAKLGRTGARFRLSSTGGLAPTALAPNGEVEDYEALICQRRPLTNAFFTSITVTNIGSDQVVTMQWNAEAGVAYQVEYATTLSSPPPTVWTDVGPETVGPANSLTRTNAWLLERYYRIRVPNVCP